jgi:hypothetical protein
MMIDVMHKIVNYSGVLLTIYLFFGRPSKKDFRILIVLIIACLFLDVLTKEGIIHILFDTVLLFIVYNMYKFL